MKDNVIEMPKASLKDRVKNTFRNKKVQIGIAIAVTAVVTSLIARSELFETRYSLSDVEDIMNDVIKDAELVKS